MRTTIFAFMGLTAAAGLALVAIFAQLGFPLLSPAPLPAVSSEQSVIAEAVPLGQSSGVVGGERARDAVASPQVRKEGRSGSSEPGERKGGVDDSPVPVSSPESEEGAGPAEPTEAPPPTTSPTPAATPAPAAEPAPVPAASPEPDAKPASSKPSTARPAKSKAGRTDAKPAKAKAVKSEGKQGKPAAKPASAPAYEPAPPPPPTSGDNGQDQGRDGGNGKALGHDK
jgi:hypothetical protein